MRRPCFSCRAQRARKRIKRASSEDVARNGRREAMPWQERRDVAAGELPGVLPTRRFICLPDMPLLTRATPRVRRCSGGAPVRGAAHPPEKRPAQRERDCCSGAQQARAMAARVPRTPGRECRENAFVRNVHIRERYGAARGTARSGSCRSVAACLSGGKRPEFCCRYDYEGEFVTRRIGHRVPDARASKLFRTFCYVCPMRTLMSPAR